MTWRYRGVTATLRGGNCHITGGSLPHDRGGTATLQGDNCHITGGVLPHYRGVTTTLLGVGEYLLRPYPRSSLTRDRYSASGTMAPITSDGCTHSQGRVHVTEPRRHMADGGGVEEQEQEE